MTRPPLGLEPMAAKGELGRFLSPDPVGFAEGGVGYFNRYAYVGNDPINATDPFGLWALKFGFNIDIYIPPLPGLSLDFGGYVGTNDAGQIEGGIAGGIGTGFGLDLSAGFSGEVHPLNNVDSLSGPYVETELSAGPLAMGNGFTEGSGDMTNGEITPSIKGGLEASPLPLGGHVGGGVSGTLCLVNCGGSSDQSSSNQSQNQEPEFGTRSPRDDEVGT